MLYGEWIINSRNWAWNVVQLVKCFFLGWTRHWFWHRHCVNRVSWHMTTVSWLEAWTQKHQKFKVIVNYVTKSRPASALGGFLYLELLTALETEKFKVVTKLPAKGGGFSPCWKDSTFICVLGEKGLKASPSFSYKEINPTHRGSASTAQSCFKGLTS